MGRARLRKHCGEISHNDRNKQATAGGLFRRHELVQTNYGKVGRSGCVPTNPYRPNGRNNFTNGIRDTCRSLGI